MKICTVMAAALAGAALFAPLAASAQTPADRWTFSLMPYLWLPSIEGKLNYGPPPTGGGSANVKIDPDTILDNLEFAFMINGEARKGRWLVATDVIYLNFGNMDSTVQSVDFNPGPGRINVSTAGLDTGTHTDLEGWVWSVVGGYAAIQEPRASLDVLGGFRYLNLDAKASWQLSATVTGTGPGGATATFDRQGSAEKSEDLWAAIVGVKGRAKLGASEWFVNYYADIGGGSSAFTWQGAAGIGYAFKWGDIVFDYRYLYYSQSDDDKLIDNISFGGFALGANFRF